MPVAGGTGYIPLDFVDLGLAALLVVLNGALSLAVGGFHFKADDNRRRFLFFAWGNQEVDFWTAASKMTLNSTLYAQHRDQVKEKLGAAATGFIEELTIA